ncbi:MAG: AEC family transporter [Planctomycetota bacterium]
MAVLLEVLDSLTPLIVLVAAGAFLLGGHFYNEAFRAGLDRLVYWVCMPALLIAKLAESGEPDAAMGWTALSISVITMALFAAGVGLWWVLGSPKGAMGVVAQAAGRGNIAYVGLPVIQLGGGSHEAVAIAAVAMVPAILLFNLVAVPLLIAGAGGDGAKMSPGRTIKSIVTNPLIIACVVGLTIALLDLRLPKPATDSLAMLGRPASPLALLSVGGSLLAFQARAHLVPALAVAALKLGLGLGLGVLAVTIFRLDHDEALVLLIMAACPTAVTSVVMVGQIGGDRGLAASCVGVTTALSVFSLGAALAIVEVWYG